MLSAYVCLNEKVIASNKSLSDAKAVTGFIDDQLSELEAPALSLVTVAVNDEEKKEPVFLASYTLTKSWTVTDAYQALSLDAYTAVSTYAA